MVDPTMGAEEGHHDDRSCGRTAPPAPPHVVVFPFPAQGHMNPMLILAELLSLAAIRVTFLVTDHNYRRLLRSAGVRATLASHPCLHLYPIPDGLSEGIPRDASRFMELAESLESNACQPFQELLSNGVTDADGVVPVTCVVADGIMGFPLDIAEELGVPIIAFRTSSACSFWAYQCIPKLIAAGIIPFQEGCTMDELVGYVPGMESFLRLRDLPSFCRVKDVEDPKMRMVMRFVQNVTRYRGLVFNTPEFAEDSVLPHIRGQIPSTYPIGPLHGLLQALEHSNCAVEANYRAATSYSASLWEEEHTCMEWLDDRPPSSVVFVSFGSVVLLTREERLELWHGVVNSGFHFLWVARPGLLVDGGDAVDQIPWELTKGRGFPVKWAPQQEVLAHPAVGCFLTHSGWNSTLESMWAGVPMVCWPYFADQPVNSRFVSEVWGIGVDLKDTCDRATVEKAVREVMAAGERRSKMREAVAGISKMMKEGVEEGGSSYVNLERLIRDIRAMSLKKA